jgi:hypothetical protein
LEERALAGDASRYSTLLGSAEFEQIMEILVEIGTIAML